MATIRRTGKLKAYLDSLAKDVGKKKVRAGFFASATYPDGKPVAMVAAIQNFGAPSRGIPPRPFFSKVVNEGPPKWAKVGLRALKDGDDVETALKKVGEEMRGEIQDSIRDTNSPPLKPATIARKGFDKPLIDTAHMLDSANFEVIDS